MPSLLSGTGLTCLVPHLCLFAARSAALPCVGSASALHHYTTRPSRVLTYSHPCSRTCAACKTKLLISVALEESASMTKLLISVALEESLRWLVCAAAAVAASSSAAAALAALRPWLTPPRGEVMHDFFPQMID